ncbi:hypothetical protein ACJJTC_014165 [Scirpophaga incertulas]
MLYNKYKPRAQKLCDMAKKSAMRRDKNEDITETIRSHQVVALEEDNISDINIRSMQESPLPIDFDESEINELAKLIDDDIFASPEITCDYEISNIDSTARIPSTSHPSPDCSINHLDNDCSNHFCPYYIGKENELPFEAATYNNSPAFQSESSTPQANTPLSCFSNDSPQPQSDIRSRKDKGNVRKRHVKDWLDVKRKTLRNSGKQYVTRKGLVKAKREMGPPCSCRMKCYDKFSREQRQHIFYKFWSLGNRHQQWTFLTNLVTRKIKRRMLTDVTSKRKFTLIYRLPISSNDKIIDYVNVCKKIFLNTISISDQVVNTALNKLDTSSGIISTDQRGKHSNHPKQITQVVIESVCNHIQSLQPVESHFTRKRSEKLYLDGDLNYHRLFNMYNEWLETNSFEEKAKTERQYRDIVNENFKLSFYVPKKDQCDQCHIYKNIKTPTEEQITLHEQHIRSKNICRELKQLDKNESKCSNGKVASATFDFQKILNAPHGQLSVLYYKRKLSVFHFTIFDLANKEAFCYMWHECEGKRGASDVSSCLLKYITKKQAEGVTDFRFWSDNCAGQNRNRIVFAFYMYVAQKFNISIKHTFLEKGHTQAEGDSVHALIEHSSKNKLVYTPMEWFSLVRWAKQDGKPYNVIEMTHSDFFEFRSLLTGRNWTKNIKGENVHWNKIKQVRVCAGDPFKIDYRYDLCHNSFDTIAVNTNTRRRQNKRTAENICPLYPNRLPIPKAKFDDLLSLCTIGLIPESYHDFYESLRVDAEIQQDDSMSSSDS